MAKRKDVGRMASMMPEDIKAEKANLQFLILEQMNRVNWLLAFGLGSLDQPGFKQEMVIKGIEFGLKSIEAMLTPFLIGDKTDYEKNAQEIKNRLKPQQLPNHRLELLLSWYSQISVSLSSAGLLPAKIEEFEVSAESFERDFEND